MQPPTGLSYDGLHAPSRAASAKSKSAVREPSLWAAVFALAFIGGIGWVYGATHAAGIERLPTAPELSLYVAQTNKDLAWCASTVTEVSPLLHTVLAGGSSPADRLALSVAATEAQGRCSNFTNGAGALNSIGPWKGTRGFNGFYWNSSQWDTADNARVLAAAVKVSNDPTSTKYLANLILAANYADYDVRTMRTDLATEAGYIHMKDIPAIHVPTWNLTTASAKAVAPN